MSMRDRLILAIALVVGAGVAHAQAQQGPNLGRVATPEEIAAWDIDVSPDGAGLPAGSSTARKGAAIYAEKCESCHGPKGKDGPIMPLAGGMGTIDGVKKPTKTVGSYWPYATSVFAYVRRAMPFYETKSLSNDELYGATAYILFVNGLIGEDEEMNAQTLAKVKMPNRDGFFFFKRGD